MKVLVAGESWTTFSTHVKGADSFTTSKYAQGIEPLRTALRGFGHEVTHMPAEHVPDSFPSTAAELGQYDVVILSDIGSNSFYLSTETFERSVSRPDRLETLRQWVGDGGALVMVGGYLSYSGIEAKARFGRSALAHCLPVAISDFDDRAERPDGAHARVDLPGHPLAAGLAGEWPPLLGYNRVGVRAGAVVVATVDGGVPLLVTWDYGDGRATAFTSECAPHWAPPGFLGWPGYATLWNNIVTWTAARRPETGGEATADIQTMRALPVSQCAPPWGNSPIPARITGG
jgi:uncharacterized membrane protein